MGDRRGAALHLALLAALAVGLFAQASSAQPDGTFTRRGAYLALGGAYAVDNSRIAQFSVNSLGLGPRLGYRMAPHIAVEAQFETIDGFDVTVGGTDVGSVEPWALTANVKAYIHPWRRFQPFLVLGMGLVRAKFVNRDGDLTTLGLPGTRHASGFGLRTGGGIDLYVTPRIAVSFDGTYLFTTGGVEGLDFVSIGFGVQYRFGPADPYSPR